MSHIDAGAVTFVVGGALTVTFVFDVFVHPPIVTVAVSCNVPTADAVYVMLGVPWPPVIVPFVIDHAYVAPVVVGTLATAVEVVHIDGAVVIVDAGGEHDPAEICTLVGLSV